jgi:hypothetical protein
LKINGIASNFNWNVNHVDTHGRVYPFLKY